MPSRARTALRQLPLPGLAILAMLILALTPAAARGAVNYGAGTGDPEAVDVSLGELLGSPEEYVDRKVRVRGRIADVCPMAGCWIDIKGSKREGTIRFKVTDGEIVFPVSARGRKVIAEGVMTRIEMTREQAVAYERHLADERNATFDPSTVDGPRTTYRINGTGARVR